MDTCLPCTRTWVHLQHQEKKRGMQGLKLTGLLGNLSSESSVRKHVNKRVCLSPVNLPTISLFQ